MKIIGWNCNGAFRKKNEKILSMNPDILIISECEHPDKLMLGKLTPEPNDLQWVGENKNKGIGIFSFGDYSFELIEEYNPRFKLVIPIKVNNHEGSFLLFCIWTKENKYDKNAGYIGQVWFAINYYSNLISNYSTIIIGDFNSNKIWDRKRPLTNHSQVVNLLKNQGLESLYHLKYNEEQGEESSPTFFLHKKISKPYHIDYCFASKDIYQREFEIKVEEFENWIELSDHVPIITEFDWKPSQINIVNSLKESVISKFNLIDNIPTSNLDEIKFQILKNVESYLQLEEDSKEELRLKIVANTEGYLKIVRLINELKNRKNE